MSVDHLEGVAYDINDKSQMVGISHLGLTVWDNGTMKSLPVPVGLSWSRPVKINNYGQVVGNIRLDYQLYHAHYWTLAGEFEDLNDLIPEGSGWELMEARGTNDDGLIVGTGRYFESEWRGFLLTPIIDINPGQYPNKINLRSNGVVRVAIRSHYEFDATTVDPNSVRFAGAKPSHRVMRDTTGDGYIDIVFHFHTRTLDLTKECTEATLTCQTYDGQTIEGSDSIMIIGPGRKAL